VRNACSAVLVTVLVTPDPRHHPPLTSRGVVSTRRAGASADRRRRLAYARLFVQPFHQRALIVGAGSAGRTLATALRAAPDDANPFRGTGYSLVGFIDDDRARCGDCVEGLPVLGGRESLLAAVETLRVDKVILAITHRHAIHDDLFDALLLCRERGLRVVTMATVYEHLTGRVPIDHVGRDLHMVVPMDEDAGERAYLFLKRLADLTAAGVGLATLLPLALLLALVNACSSPGPLFYHQRRVGRGGMVFEMLKFRSMRVDAERGTGAVWARAGDDRITWAGRWLRRTRLDELPQCWNILRGDMSLVGPRPERPEFVEDLARTIPFYRARHAVRPASPAGRRSATAMATQTRTRASSLSTTCTTSKHAARFSTSRSCSRPPR
jgi:lipopolysaccharide/colanic/teichoic acid biosynthesis glycosyltransferase